MAALCLYARVLGRYLGKELLHGSLLALELQLVWHGQQLAAAALLCYGACVRLVSHVASVAHGACAGGGFVAGLLGKAAHLTFGRLPSVQGRWRQSVGVIAERCPGTGG